MKPSYRTLVWRGDSVKKKKTNTNENDTVLSKRVVLRESYGGIKLKTRGKECCF